MCLIKKKNERLKKSQVLEKITIAKIGRPHGLKGEIRVFPYFKSEISFWLSFKTFWIDEKLYFLQNIKKLNKHFVFKLGEIDCIDLANELKQKNLKIEKKMALKNLNPHCFSLALIGYEVFCQKEGSLLGVVDDYDSQAGGCGIFQIHLYESQKKILVPRDLQYFSFKEADKKKLVLKNKDLFLNLN